ncbi:MAG TPA: PCRF domain-containing protein, partial [Acidimicrobiales bacterium]|nr:PCRF domain-containing protein [Acidimicrobiales bacterium]
MFERLAELVAEYENVLGQLADPGVLADQRRLREVSKRHKELEPVVDGYRSYLSAQADLVVAREMLAEAEGEDRELLGEEVAATEKRLAELEDEIKILLLPHDPNDGRSVIVEIRGAEGGEEANLFARDLFEMYSRYAERTGLKAEVLSSDPSPMGGYNEITMLVKGPEAWGRLKHEGGPHRVQRVPVTESQGRVHTSSATVTVLPEAEDVEVQIDEKDLRIDVYRSTGPGG